MTKREKIEAEINRLDEGVFRCRCIDDGDSFCIRCSDDMRAIDGLKKQLAALEGERDDKARED